MLRDLPIYDFILFWYVGNSTDLWCERGVTSLFFLTRKKMTTWKSMFSPQGQIWLLSYLGELENPVGDEVIGFLVMGCIVFVLVNQLLGFWFSSMWVTKNANKLIMTHWFKNKTDHDSWDLSCGVPNFHLLVFFYFIIRKCPKGYNDPKFGALLEKTILNYRVIHINWVGHETIPTKGRGSSTQEQKTLLNFTKEY